VPALHHSGYHGIRQMMDEGNRELGLFREIRSPTLDYKTKKD